jgi:diguanylate cyclase (GGDEF)-like protein
MTGHNDLRDRFVHLFSSPLTAMRGAVDLLRHPGRTSNDALTRELLDAIERSYARLSRVVDVLVQHSRIEGDVVECRVPLRELGLGPVSKEAALAPQAPVGTAPPTTAVPAGLRGSVLLIGALAGRRDLFATALGAAGYDVLAADDGAQGIDLARAYRPALIVLDLDQLAPAALQVSQVLLEDPDTKAIPIIHALGQADLTADVPVNVELLPRGAAPEALLELVEQCIAAARARAVQAPTVLIVDDDADIRRIVALRLQQDGYRVVLADTGASALIAAQKQLFDLIILDLLLPDIDGFSVLGALRARTATAGTPIMLLSAKDSPREKVRGLRLGADDYVTKPFSPAELQARVRATLRRHERESGANPSTRLPGNIAIERALRQRIEQGTPFAVCYADIDNFKAYNDTYSFLKGDAVIQQTARVLLEAVETHGRRDDFVGHIGGDDFVVITTPDCVAPICEGAIDSFDRIAPLFYDAATRLRGFIDAHDRQGRPMRYPFVSLSIGIVSTDRAPIQHVAEVAQRAIDSKKRAKDLPGSRYVIED